MKKSRFTEIPVANALRQAEAGMPMIDLCRSLGYLKRRSYIWKKKYGDLGASEVRRLRKLEEENARLKRVAVDLTLDKNILQARRVLRPTAAAAHPLTRQPASSARPAL